jgi:SAM-dependent methyltransferase
METTVRRFDRRASTYETSALQPFLFGPVQHTALQLARQHLPQARRILDVGCGTGQLLRRARPCYPLASLIGIDLAGQMLATANALTPEKLSVDFIRAQAEQLPFPDAVFDLVLTTLSLRHWTDSPGRDRRDRPSAHGGWCAHPRRRLSKASAPSPAAPCCADAPPRSQPTSAGCWPFTAWPLSAAIAPAGSVTGRPGHRRPEDDHDPPPKVSLKRSSLDARAAMTVRVTGSSMA